MVYNNYKKSEVEDCAALHTLVVKRDAGKGTPAGFLIRITNHPFLADRVVLYWRKSMEEFQIIYRILKILQQSMDLEEFDKENLSAERLGLSEPKWCRLMAMLLNEGFITGGEAWASMDCGYPRVALTRPEITLKGLEYLEENSLMRKAVDMAKGIINTLT